MSDAYDRDCDYRAEHGLPDYIDACRGCKGAQRTDLPNDNGGWDRVPCPDCKGTGLNKSGLKAYRWIVSVGCPSGWDVVARFKTPEGACKRFEKEEAARGSNWTYPLAIFDNEGEGEPFGPDEIREIFA